MTFRVLVVALLLSVAAGLSAIAQQSIPSRQPDVVFVPTPSDVVDAMLRLAKVTSADVVYDLGSGDGRIVIAAAKMYGARGLGIDIDPERTREATATARIAGVSDKVAFRTQDLFTADISAATVVTVYLSPAINARLAGKLMKELKPGTRVVSHAFGLGSWTPRERIVVADRPIFLWIVAPEAPGKN